MSLRLVLFGPPGVGKGTQSNLLAQKFCIPKISTGDMFREVIDQKTSLGEKAALFIHQGKLVPDDTVIDIVKNRLKRKDCQNGFILDGFPRTLPQAKALHAMTAIDVVISLNVSEEDLIRRLEGRRTCKQCAQMYHLEFQPPQKLGICDACGGSLIQRKDDRRETVQKRLEQYQQLTYPLIQYYKKKQLLKEVNGSGSIESIFQRILKELNFEVVLK